jgi:elongation factor 1-alpha
MAEQKKAMADGSVKTHVSIVICGHVDSGKSTTTGRLIFDLGGIPEREMTKLKDEAKTLGKDSFAFAFYMDKSKEERARGVTIACTTKEFFTDRYHYTVIDAPGHRDFIKNMISGASQADVALIMVPADGNFTTAIQRGNHKQGLVQGQTRQHARLINLLGVKQIIVGINKMDTDIAGYKQERYDEIKAEMASTLIKVGWKKDFVDKSTPFMPISGWIGDNLLKPSDNMKWWKGMDVVKPLDGKKIHVDTLLQCMNDMVEPPVRDGSKASRMPVSGVYKIKGVGDVITGRVEQGVVKPGSEVKFVPTDTSNLACTGKIFTVEMHHTTHEQANAGDNVGLNVKGLAKENMPRVGDVMVEKKDSSLGQVASFCAQVQILDHPGQLKPGYSPIAFIRTGRSAVKLSKIDWKVGKSTGGQKSTDAPFLAANEMAQCHFEPQQPFTCEGFQACEGLGRVAILEGASVVMLGKVVKVTNGTVVKAEPKAATAGKGKK